jgi:hypothetical protein
LFAGAAFYAGSGGFPGRSWTLDAWRGGLGGRHLGGSVPFNAMTRDVIP